MAFQTSTPTALPLNLDGTLARPSWAEGSGTMTRPGVADLGYAPGNPVGSAEINYAWQSSARTDRSAAIDRSVFTDDGLFTSCEVRAGTWNVGGGTLNVTLDPPSRIVVDLDVDGGVVIEIWAKAGSPVMLAPDTDNYVDITEAGVVTVASVSNDPILLPPPPLAANSVRFYMLATDDTELVSAELFGGPADVPCLANVGALSLSAETVNIRSGGAINVGSGATIDGPAASCVLGTIEAQIGFVGNGASTAVMTQGATIPTGKSLALAGTAAIAGVGTTIATLGAVNYVAGGTAPSATGTGVNAGGELLYGTNLVHNSPNGFVYATGDQQAITLLAGSHEVATTTVAVVGAGGFGSVRVRVEGQVQVGALGDTIDISVQEDQTANPVFTDIGIGPANKIQTITALKDTSDVNDWQHFVHERVFAAGTSTPTLYRARIDPDVTTAWVKEVRVTVVGERG